jgi:peptidoglycan/xylan/chitin deacetylase (PgdA/CDA1 family)
VALAASVALVVLVRLLVGEEPLLRWLPALLVAAAVPGHTGGSSIVGTRVARRRWTVGVALGAAGALLAWTGANDPQLSWFGPVVSNGPRDVPAVAITFDDGPNDPFSLGIAEVLESRGARGTFYLVGAAIDRDPGIVRSLVERGHQVGNHSYHHDYWRWLDPRYPELDRTQAAFERAVGGCPTTYRPPHGQRTPFISALVAAAGMQTITWDVSAMDWTLTDGDEVARRVLDRVQPGSIVLLHDGLDGVPDANRQVVLDALPIILDGLEERGLRAVTVDELVGTDGSLTDC